MGKKEKQKVRKLQKWMRKKMLLMFTAMILLLCTLIGRLMYIQYTSGEKYEKKVLSMQSYDSTTIPFQRGDIVDRNGTVLATSVAVYNIILDCSVLCAETTVDGEKVQKYLEPTLELLFECFPELDQEQVRQYTVENSKSMYIVLAKKIPYARVQEFLKVQNEVNEKGKKVNPNIRGIWFEKEYERQYPFDTLASSVIGFTSAGNVGTIGLENYYNDWLNGTNGREFGYLNSDSNFEKTVIPAIDGNNIVTTIDANIQSIVEQKILEFNEVYRDNYREGAGSENTAVIIMNPNTGEIVAMAEYPTFDLNNPRDTSLILSESEQLLNNVSSAEISNRLNALWKNYCITETYEPGSVQKTFTIAGGLETGLLHEGLTFMCDGYEMVAGHKVKCVNIYGHGMETLSKALCDSCNDALMQMAFLIGKEEFLRHQEIFNFGMKTGIDLPGEANTSTLVYTVDKMTKIDLATNSFGQNYNCTMVQMASAFSSVINGGYYYQPHLVSKIVDANGGTVTQVEPTVLKQTISASTSATLKEYLYDVINTGTAQFAKVDGYSMGGKTGTAETLPRGNGNYVVSFIGFLPYENPELVIYVVIDRPNSKDQPHSYYAQNLSREILEAILPYTDLYPDEELTGINEGLDVTGTDIFYNGNRTEEDEIPNTDEIPDETIIDTPESMPNQEETTDVPENPEDIPSEDVPSEDVPSEDAPTDDTPEEDTSEEDASEEDTSEEDESTGDD